jgi:hypothetical protein
METMIPAPPSAQLPTIRGPRRALASVSRKSDSEAQIANITGNKIIGDYYNESSGNYIGFDDDITDILGITNTLNKIYLEGLTYSGNPIENMLLTNINDGTDGADKEYLLSIRLYNDVNDNTVNTAFTKTLYDFLQNIANTGVNIYLFDNFRQFYKVENIRIIMSDQLSLNFILFVDNDSIYNIEWKHTQTQAKKKLKSFKYDKIILGCSFPSLQDFAAKNSTDIANFNPKAILSKSAMFCISLILYITYTAEMFYNDFPDYDDRPKLLSGGNNQALGGNKVVKKKRKNKFPIPKK